MEMPVEILHHHPKVQLPNRPLPQSLDDLRLPESFLTNLILKHCFYLDIFKVSELEERLKLPVSLILQVVEELIKKKFLEVLGTETSRSVLGLVALANRYALAEEGKKRAAYLLEHDAYVGPVPVTLQDYWDQVNRQSVQRSSADPARIAQIFEGLVISPDLVKQLGPAIVSGKPLFLYGPPGNGKTTIASRLGRIWNDSILVPYALYIDGHVIRVFDEIIHRPMSPSSQNQELRDRRWEWCSRPVVIVGGELTLEMMDLEFSPSLKYYEAPLQLKANNGLLVVDDFGRQQISPQILLNRWIIPMENQQDFLRLHTGQKFAIPFDVFLVFATNLDPRTLVDDAFLRRIRSKIKLEAVSQDQFVEIFRLVCQTYNVEYEPEAVQYLLDHYYLSQHRRMAACHPRDLLEYILDYARFHRIPPRLTRENLDRACGAYFVS